MINVNHEMSKTYKPSEFEKEIYSKWLKEEHFKAVVDKDKIPFTIVIPPPNVTGKLHMGHALNETIQDILIRFKRMQGYSTLWVVGTDHAGIATQIKVEENLKKTKNILKHDLKREVFLNHVWNWKERYEENIKDQIKKLGCSCDWSRECFTLDQKFSIAVNEVFVNLYNKDYIYKDKKIINWCTRCETALSDTEVEYAQYEGNLWYIKYQILNSEEFIIVATTRPETIPGDTAIAVNPRDNRYKKLIGKNVKIPIFERLVPIIADESVKEDFGTGCLKITPAHSQIDFEIGVRHKLAQISVISEKGILKNLNEPYNGLEIKIARKKIVQDLQKHNLLLKTEKHTHNIGICHRCGTVIEPLLSKQWFVSMKTLAKNAIKMIKNNEICFMPKRFEKIYFNWMENVQDWCISRQLWWGHRIPAFYCKKCNKTKVSKDVLIKCSECDGKLIQENDVLDTWFSSAIWPFATLGWPIETEDFKYFYPTDVLVTGYDIIFFWVARMIFSAIEHTNSKPFKKVFFHGLVRDEQGRKMSKSLGNGIDPIDIIEKYGADSLRFTLITGNSPGKDTRFSNEKIISSRNFANKIWNAARFINLNSTTETFIFPQLNDLQLEDKWILHELNELIKEVTENLEKFEIGIAAQKIYNFIWDNFCDWYIESVKPRLFKEKNIEKDFLVVRNILKYVLNVSLKLLHPFMPFITEKIWNLIFPDKPCIIISDWPKFDKYLVNEKSKSDIEILIKAVKNIRNTRKKNNISYSKKINIKIFTNFSELFGYEFFKNMSNINEIVIKNRNDEKEKNCILIVMNEAEILISTQELINKEEKIRNLEKEKEKILKELECIKSKLENYNFINKAPKKIIEIEKTKEENYKNTLNKILKNIDKLTCFDDTKI
ncbi:MAG: valine--tRNA ligase [Clostridiales bacterium]|nr:valine--tRNA ligase [Clostridiales bacterium]